jgi:hypothetical protein
MLNLKYAECRKYAVYAEHHNNECHYAECLNVIMLNVVAPFLITYIQFTESLNYNQFS